MHWIRVQSLKFPIFFFGLIWSLPSFGNNYIDSIEQVLQFELARKNQTEVHRLSNELGNIFTEERNPDQALIYYQQALKLSEAMADNDLLLTDLFKLGSLHQSRKEYKEALVYFFRMLHLAELDANIFIRADVLVQIAEVYQQLGDYEMAYDYQFVALDIQERAKDSLGIFRSMVELGNIFFHQCHYDRALLYFHRAMDLSFRLSDFFPAVDCLKGIEQVYAVTLEMPATEPSEDLFRMHEAIYQKAREQGDQEAAAATLLSLGALLVSNGNYPEAYQKLKEGYKLKRRLKDLKGSAICTKLLGELRLQENDARQAVNYLSDAIRYAGPLSDPNMLSALYLMMSEARHAAGQHGLAYHYLKQHLALKDGLAKAKENVEKGKFTIRYELQKQENEIALLKSERELLQKNKKINNLNAFLLITIVFFLLVASILLYNRNQTQRASNKLLEEKNSKIMAQTAQLLEKNEMIHRQNERLAQSNEDLKQFAQVASHDLKEPLRMIGSYTSLIRRRYEKLLEPSAGDFFNYITDGVQRMEQLLTDLLAYSKVNGGNQQKKPVRIERVVELVLRDLQQKIESSKATINLSFQSRPVVKGNESQLIQLFQNLIGNALKFKGAQPPVITIGEQSGDGQPVFYVKDNGIGIATEDQGKIFEMFKRVKHDTEFEGTGIGLATVKRIIDRHFGKIWVESEPGKGSQFYFTLPRWLENPVPPAGAENPKRQEAIASR